MVAAKAVATGDYKQVWMVNHDTESDGYIHGTGKAEHYNVAVFVPADLIDVADLSVGGFSFFLLTPEVSNVKAWVSTRLPRYGTAADLETVEVAQSDLGTQGNFNDITFSKNYPIPEEGLYVGWSFDVTGLNQYYSRYPLVFTDTQGNRDGGMYVSTASNTSWQEYPYNLYARILVGSENFKDYAAAAVSMEETYALVGKKTSIPVVVKNQGCQPITSLSYSISMGGKPAGTGTVYPRLSTLNATTTVELPVTAGKQAVAQQATVTLTAVNNQPNESAEPATAGRFITMLNKPTPVPVVEEFTATWCGWCPSGIEGMKRARETYGDQAVLIGVHCNDIMKIVDYTSVMQKIDGLPSALLNRNTYFYPTPSSFIEAIETAKQDIAPATLELSATWTDEKATSVQLNTEATFPYSDSEAHFALAYVLTEDGVTGTGSDWTQQNFYNGSSGDPDMQYWYSAGRSLPNYVYDHVAIAAWGIQKGLTASSISSHTAGTPLPFSYTGRLSAPYLVIDKSKVRAIALLIDTQSGSIVQATQVPVQAPSLVSLEDITTLIDQYLSTGTTVTLQDITTLIDRYLEQ